MQKIAIIGNAGGGKSTLARHLSTQLSLPLYEVDRYQWLPGWERLPVEELDAIDEQWLAEPAWIIDGWGSWENLEKRFAQADTIILVDFPFWLHLWWTTKRHILAILGLYPHWPPPGCKPWPKTKTLYQIMWKIQKEMRGQLITLAYRYKSQTRLVHLHSPHQMRKFLAETQITTHHNSTFTQNPV